MDMDSVEGALGVPAPIDIISRLYNLRDGNPDIIDTRPEVVQKLRQLASKNPLFEGVAPPSHPHPWLFDGVAKDPRTTTYNVSHLRQDAVRGHLCHL